MPSAKLEWGSWPAVLAGWVIVSLILAGQSYFFTPNARTDELYLFVLIALATWSPWVVAAPLILNLARRLPIRREAWISITLTHLLLSIAVGAAHLAIKTVLDRYFFASSSWHPSFGQVFLRWVPIYGVIELFLYWAILGAGMAVDAGQLSRQLSEARLQTLQMQIHPHFLYNALNTISMMVRGSERNEAVEMIAKLGELLRSSLQPDAAQEVSLEHELNLVRQYLEIEQYRFGDRLQLSSDVPAELLNARVPHLILQPLVENAVRHGVARSTDAVAIRLSARRDGGVLYIDVCDDGPGPSATPGDGGIGLTNVRARLQLLHGARAEFALESLVPRGTRATLRLPYGT